MPLDITTDYAALVTRDGLLKLTEPEIDYLQSYLARHDRGGYYLALYNMTGNTQAITQAQIATFSEGLGGTAFFANFMLQNYFVPSIYPGVYHLSQAVAARSLAAIEAKFDLDKNNGTNLNTGYINTTETFDSARFAWRDNGVEPQFPGNLLDTVAAGGDFVAAKLAWFSQMGVSDPAPSESVTMQRVVNVINSLMNSGTLSSSAFTTLATSDGTLAALIGTLGGPILGKRIADYESRPDLYTIQALPDATYKVAISKVSNKVVGVFNNQLFPTSWDEFLNRLVTNWASIVASIVLRAPGLVTSAVTAFLNSYLSDFHRTLTQGTPNFDGDVSPQILLPNLDGTVAPYPNTNTHSLPTNDTRWGTGGWFPILWADTLNPGEGDDRVFGGDGDDELYGVGGNDVIYGQSHNDRLYGNAGNDVLRGGHGNDRLYGGEGNDLLDGDDSGSVANGADELYGEGGNDVLAGGRGDDVLDGGDGHDQVFGGAGNDPLVAGGAGNDHVEGNDGADLVDGGSGHDVLLGGSGIDELVGGSDDDLLLGGADDDHRLEGGAGRDWLDGGAGFDNYHLSTTDTAVDTIADSESTGRLFVDGVMIGGFTCIQPNLYESTGGLYRIAILGDGSTTSTATLYRKSDGRTLANIIGIQGSTVLGYTLPPPPNVGSPTWTFGSRTQDDTIHGTVVQGSTTLTPGFGQIRGWDGHDWIVGGTYSRMEIVGDTGNDVLYDQVLATNDAGQNTLLFGGAGSDFLYGTGASMTLSGGTGNDFISSARYNSAPIFTVMARGTNGELTELLDQAAPTVVTALGERLSLNRH